jgi:hypothetical protein
MVESKSFVCFRVLKASTRMLLYLFFGKIGEVLNNL